MILSYGFKPFASNSIIKLTKTQIMASHSEFNRHRFAFFMVGMILSCSFVLWAFSWKGAERKGLDYDISDHTEDIQIISTWMPDPEPKKEIKKKRTQKVEDPFRDESRLILKDLVIKKVELPKVDLNPISKASSTPNKLPLITTGNDHIMPDVKASFPGGNEALKRFLKKHLQYPQDILEEDESGKVVVAFIVDEEGHIVNVKILKSDLGPSAIREAQRVIGLMPNWIPGYYKGQKVRSQYIQSFNFVLY